MFKKQKGDIGEETKLYSLIEKKRLLGVQNQLFVYRTMYAIIIQIRAHHPANIKTYQISHQSSAYIYILQINFCLALSSGQLGMEQYWG